MREDGALTPKNFAITGVAGYVAQRHLKAIVDTGNRVVAAVDPHDAVGILDRYSFDVRFFTEFERFDRHLEKLRRGPAADHVQFVSICSPNYLHDAHIRLALRIGADAICEKPLVINPWNLDALEDLQNETGRHVYTVLQLRRHPALIALKERLDAAGGHHDVELTYITARGGWYDVSWKGSVERAGGVATNIGIHFFDLLLWLFGGVLRSEVHLDSPKKMAGSIELLHASVRWYLSTDRARLAIHRRAGQADDVSLHRRRRARSRIYRRIRRLAYVRVRAGAGGDRLRHRPTRAPRLSSRTRSATLR